MSECASFVTVCLAWYNTDLPQMMLRYPILILSLAYLALATLYNVVTPPFEALDEFHHYPYVKRLADGQGLPVLGTDAPASMYRQEGGQPPLYYGLAALGTFWVDTGDMDALYKYNPHATAGNPTAPDNKNMVLHGPDETFPGEGKFLALHLVRLLSTVLGLVTLVATYFLSRAASGGNKLVATGAAALVAFNPTFLFVAGSVNNDNLVNAVAAVTILVLTWIILGRRSAYIIWLLGFLVGVAALSKLSGLALLPVSLIALGLVYLREGRWKAFGKASVIVTGISLSVAGWWYLRNWQLYGDPLGLNVFLSVVGKRSTDIAQLLGEFEGFKLSFWGVFGGFNILMGGPAYWLYDIVAVLAAVGLVYLTVTRAGRPVAGGRKLLAMHVLWVGAVTVALARWTSMTWASQGRLVFPAFPSLALFFALGLYSLGPQSLRRFGLAATSLVFAAIAVAVPFLYITPAYPPPPLISAQEAERYPFALNASFEDKIALLGYDLEPDTVQPGGEVAITLYWRVLDRMDKDYSIFIHILGQNGRPIGQRDSYPGAGSYPTSMAKPGDYLKDRYIIKVSPDITEPIAATVRVGIYELSTWLPLQALNDEGHALGSSPVVGRLKIAATGAPRATPDDFTVVKSGMGDDVGLMAYRLHTREVQPGREIGGRLQWKALRRPDTDYTVFVQILGPNGLVAQYDSQPQGGQYPTSFWDADEQVLDEFKMAIPDGTEAGVYNVIAGMYNPNNGRRVHFVGQDHLDLGVIEVASRRPN